MENAVIGILIPFAGTSLGAACVYAMKQELDRQVQRGLTGFASGVMIAASIWSLLIPAMEEAAPLGKFAFVPAVAGFWLGIFLLLALDRLVPHLHMYSEKAEGPHSHLQRTTMLVLAVTLHNIPEGMAVGVVYAGLLAGQTGISAAGALTIALTAFIVPVLPYLLSLAAGAMCYVVVEELIPEMSAGEHSDIGVLSFALGFTLMMALDVALS